MRDMFSLQRSGNIPLLAIKGKVYPKVWEKFEDKLCTVYGRHLGILFMVKSIESIAVPDVKWTV